MSLSKGKPPGPDPLPLRKQPKCTRCRNHGLSVPQKGHVKLCPFLECPCPNCVLVAERTRISNLQRKLRRTEKSREKNQQRTCAATEDKEAAPAAHRACADASPAGRARPSDTSPLSTETETATNVTLQNPLDLRSRPAACGEDVAGPGSTQGQSFPPTGVRANLTPFLTVPPDVPYIGVLRRFAPVDFIHFPFRISGHYPSGCAPYPSFIFNPPFLPPVPAGLYNHGPYGPLSAPPCQQGAVHVPTVPEPGPSTVINLQPPLVTEASQKEPVLTLSPEPPLAQADPDIVELD